MKKGVVCKALPHTAHIIGYFSSKSRETCRLSKIKNSKQKSTDYARPYIYICPDELCICFMFCFNEDLMHHMDLYTIEYFTLKRKTYSPIFPQGRYSPEASENK